MAQNIRSMLDQEALDEINQAFSEMDVDGNGRITATELGTAMSKCGFQVNGSQLREIFHPFDRDYDGKINSDEFVELYWNLKKMGMIMHPKKQKPKNLGDIAERCAFAKWINRTLADDPDCAKYLPLNPESQDLITKSQDGILLCKMINKSQPGTIDERTINKGEGLTSYQIHENLTLALNSALSIGCNITNVGPEDLYQGKPDLVLGLLWQIIRISLLSDIKLHKHPELAALLSDGESLEDIRKLSAEEILLRWVNHHLRSSECVERGITNFTEDIKDSVAYIQLLHQIAPRDAGVSTAIGHGKSGKIQIAERMLHEADKIHCHSFVWPHDVVRGHYRLNLAFVANLFNNYPALEKPENIDIKQLHEQSREEKMYCDWMNSMGVNPYVNCIYDDLKDGLVIFQLYDIIKRGCVNWNKVHQHFKNMEATFRKLENCDYALDLGKQNKWSPVGMKGKDIYEGNENLTLALVCQMMRAYTLSKLSDRRPIAEKDIIAWANEKLKKAGKRNKISSFSDQAIAEGRVVIDLVDSVKKGSINYDNVKKVSSDQDKLDNAKYAISMARKIGAQVYALPEDIIEVKSEMVMTIFACLMIQDLQPKP